MSDLLPFLVAIGVKDKVVEDLAEENKKPRDQVAKSRRVSIVSPNNRDEYAFGSLDAGHVHECHVPLVDFGNFQVLIGGVRHLTIGNPSQQFQLTLSDEEANDGEVPMQLSFGSTKSTVWYIKVLLKDFPLDIVPQLRTWQGQHDNLLPILMNENVTTLLEPAPKLEFVETPLSVDGLGDVFDSLALTDSEMERIQKHREQCKLMKAIISILPQTRGISEVFADIEQAASTLAHVFQAKGAATFSYIGTEHFRLLVINVIENLRRQQLDGDE